MSASGPALLALCGSMRRDSWNRKLLDVAVGIAESQGARVDRVHLRELELPLYDGDLEAAEGLPAGAQELRRRIGAAAGLLIATPEYNHSIPGTFKNAIDWASRPPEQPFRGLTAAIMGASPGGFGATRSMNHLRQVLMALGVWIVPTLVSVSRAADAFDDSGRLASETTRNALERQIATLLQRL